ncbi:MAG: hypothetical protein H0V88_13305 [Pyrinomonadaceae bacterium]|nr:hypothetical protein [Pyrinomonadaceae bacterium]
MKEQMRFWLVTFILALMTFSVGVSLYWSLRGMFWGVSNGIYVEKRGESHVLQVGDASIVGGALKDGDEIVAYNGEPFTSVRQDVLATYRAKPGDTYTITVRREGQILPEMRLPFARWSPPLPRRLQTLEQNILLPIISLLIGLVLFTLKPHDRQAVILAVMLALFANAFSQGAQTGFAPFVYPYWLLLLVALAWLVSDAFSPALLHLFLVFPQTSPLVKRFPRFIIYVYLLFFLLSTPYTLVLVWLRFFEPEAPFNPAKDYPILSYVSLAQFLGYLVAALVAAIVSYRQADRLARRKLRVVLSGTLIAFAPLVILIVLELSAEKLGFTSPATNQAWSMWVGVFLYATPPLMPLAFAYAIARHKVIPVSLIIRRGVRYLLVSGGSIGLQIILLSLLMPFLMYGIFRFVLRTSNPAVVGMVSAGIAILVWNLVSWLNNRVISPAIDRRFFREAYNSQAILAELGAEMRRVTDVRELLPLVAARIEAALHVESVMIFLSDPATGDLVSEFRSKHDGAGKMDATAGAPEERFARNSFVVKKLDAARGPLEVDFADADSWVNEARHTFAVEDEFARGEVEILRSTNAAL